MRQNNLTGFFVVQASRLLEPQAGRLHHKEQISQLIVTRRLRHCPSLLTNNAG